MSRHEQTLMEVAMRRPFETVITTLSAPLREGLARALVATDFRTVTSRPDERDLAQMLLSGNQPILLIVDASNEQDEALSQIKTFKKHYPSGCVAVIADHYRRSDLISAYRAGANAYFTKAMSCDAFLKTLELVMLGQTILPPELLPFIHDGAGRREHARTHINGTDAVAPSRVDSDALPPRQPDAPRSLGANLVPRLSAREKCILRCVIDGHSNKSIARKIDITEATVKVHVKAIFRKIHVNNRTQAAIWAIDNSSLIWSETEGGNTAISDLESYPVNSVERINETPAYERVANGRHACIGGSAAPRSKVLNDRV
jgi:two-component system, NarL family, nitrate/nitrite response regulator NarL